MPRPFDLNLFRLMAYFLRRWIVDKLDEVENGFREFFTFHRKAWCCRGIEQLAAR